MNADNEGAVGSCRVMDGRDSDSVSGAWRARHYARPHSDIHLHPLTPAEYLLPGESLKHAATHPDALRIIIDVNFDDSNKNKHKN